MWLRSAVLVHANGQAAYDDFLFVRLAYRLGAGLWLGPYDQLTLAKGMGCPAFLLVAFGASNRLYLSPAAPFLLAFVVLGLSIGGQAIASIYRRQRESA